ncbi:Bifunctional NAD(P)H-hydrate repair enzyme Nnr [Poriferisphaera corsica]|uniref:NAD(P)H-hydrate epimerase n=1 Tax=Poriferisphaera corsica TaxID=2528020 RepID=A0A517YU45_9BACT|nr:NAD(P)H-hydrate epimerase [Poriferisphaera corsica]QDU33682.1 Bifunctional NAD(P)H-hydrate repair enzyme Nnr [Poriferisphaera corsica]
MTYLTRAQVRSVDQLAISQLGIPSIVLMENAGRNAANIIRKLILPEHDITPSDAQIAIICGSGNNAGDGYTIARHLHNNQLNLTLYAVKPIKKLTGDALTNAKICQKMDIPIIPIQSKPQIEAARPTFAHAHIVIDAILGTGFTGSVRSPIDTLINTINSLQHPTIIAIDTPSGLEIDAGAPSNATITAHHTITFVAPKIGFKQPSATPFLGHLHVAPIGVPPQLVAYILQSTTIPPNAAS